MQHSFWQLPLVSWIGASIQRKLVVAVLGLALIPLALTAFLNYQNARQELRTAAEQKLDAVRENRSSEIEGYFQTISDQILTLSTNRAIIEAASAFSDEFNDLPGELEALGVRVDEANVRAYYDDEFVPRLNENLDRRAAVSEFLPSDPRTVAAQYLYLSSNDLPVGGKDGLDDAGDGSDYSRLHSLHHPFIHEFQQRFGYYDIFIADPDTGHIVYSVFKETDYGTSLLDGPYAGTNFGRAFRAARQSSDPNAVVLEDFAPYDPSYHAPASFISSPIVDPLNGELVGVLLFQMPVDAINAVMQGAAGLGETGETYLAGTDGLLRSDTRFSEERTILSLDVSSDALTQASAGASGVAGVAGYRGEQIVASFAPIDIDGVSWVLVAEQGLGEISAPVNALLRTTVIVSLIVAAIVAAAAYFMASSIAGPIGRVRVALDSISRGDLGTSFEHVSDDELGDMARSYSSMQGYLDELAVAAELVAEGDLTVQVNKRSPADRLGEALSRMTERMHAALAEAASAATALSVARSQLAEIAEQAAIATQEVANSTGHVAEGISQQAEASREANASVTQLSELITRVSDDAETQSRTVQEAATLSTQVAESASEMANLTTDASEGAQGAASTADDGAQLVTNTVEGIDRIKVSIDHASEQIGSLSERASEIGKIVAVIDDIAAQTNLLALNAAIEAARAGEQGRGFAVVADEVRQLAERVAGATKEIADLIQGVQEGVDASVGAMEQGASEMETGMQTAAEAGESLQRIQEAARKVSSQIDDIAGGVRSLEQVGSEMAERLTEARQITEQNTEAAGQMRESATKAEESVASIAAVAENNSAATEEVSASAEQMSAQVEEVMASTGELEHMAERLTTQLAAFKLRQPTEEPRTDAIRTVDAPPDIAERPAA